MKHKTDSKHHNQEWLKGRRVLFFLNILRDGAGMINREIGFARELSRHGADVSILSYFRPSIKLEAETITIMRVWRTGYYSFLYQNPILYPLIFITCFFKFLKLRPEVVFVDLHQEARFALWLRPFFGYKVIFTYHGVADSKFYPGKTARALDSIRYTSHKVMKRVDQVIVVSDFLLHETQRAGVEAVRIYNGVDSSRFSPEKHINNIAISAPVILFIGRYTEYKGALNIIQAFALTKQVVPDAELIMHGFFESEEYQQQIIKFISENNIKDSVYLFGPLSGPEMPYRLSIATVFANGSLDETFCMPLLEAQACGIPCVAFKAGGIPEVVVDGKTGLLAEPENIKAFSDNMINLLKDKELCTAFSENALNHAEQFEYVNLVGDLLTVLQKVLKV